MRLAELTGRRAVLANITATWHPTLDIDHVLVLDTEIARAALQQAIREAKRLEDHLDRLDHLLVPRAAFGIVGLTHHNLLDLVELVNAVKPGGVLARSTCLATEAGRHGAVLQRQLLVRKNLVRMKAHQADFARAREVEVVARAALRFLDVVGLLATCGEEARAHHALFLHDDGNTHRAKSALVGHEVDGVTEHGLMQAHAKTREHVVARARHLHAAFEVDKAVHLHELEMRARLEPAVLRKGLREVPSSRSPTTDFLVVFAAFALWNISCRRLRNLQPQCLELRLNRREMALFFGDLRLEFGWPRFERRDLHFKTILLIARSCLEFPLELADFRANLFRNPILLAACGFKSRDDRTTTFVEREKSIDVDIHALVAGAVAVLVGVFAEILQVDHGGRKIPQISVVRRRPIAPKRASCEAGCKRSNHITRDTTAAPPNASSSATHPSSDSMDSPRILHGARCGARSRDHRARPE